MGYPERQSGPSVELVVPSPPRRRMWLHVLLFFLTLVTTTHVGLMMSETAGAQADDPFFRWWASPMVWIEGLSYSLSVLAILFAHEMGHYLTAQRHGVDATPPYFIPMYSIFGTLGAFIRMRLMQRVSSDALMRIGAFGPIAGFIVCIPVLVVGLLLSDVRPAPEDLEAGMQLGDSLLLLGLEWIIFGDLPPGHDVWLHPMAFAGWAGLFVTALNLLPLGQLDGGHVAYCLLGERYNRLAPYLFGVFVALTVMVFSGWLLLCFLVLWIGYRHPPICYDLPVAGSGRTIGWVTVGIFLLSFTPVPFAGMPTLLDLITG